MISFRLTTAEYDKFRELCFRQGIRSVSELARAAINLILQHPDRAPHESLESRVCELEGRVHLLTLEVKGMNHNIAAAPAAGPDGRKCFKE